MNIPRDNLHETIVYTLGKQSISEAEAKLKFELVQELPLGSYPVIKVFDAAIAAFIADDELETAWNELAPLIQAQNDLQAEAEDNATVLLDALSLVVPQLSAVQLQYAISYIANNPPG